MYHFRFDIIFLVRWTDWRPEDLELSSHLVCVLMCLWVGPAIPIRKIKKKKKFKWFTLRTDRKNRENAIFVGKKTRQHLSVGAPRFLSVLRSACNAPCACVCTTRDWRHVSVAGQDGSFPLKYHNPGHVYSDEPTVCRLQITHSHTHALEQCYQKRRFLRFKTALWHGFSINLAFNQR